MVIVFFLQTTVNTKNFLILVQGNSSHPEHLVERNDLIVGSGSVEVLAKGIVFLAKGTLFCFFLADSFVGATRFLIASDESAPLIAGRLAALIVDNTSLALATALLEPGLQRLDSILTSTSVFILALK
jgi:hypothetical protein